MSVTRVFAMFMLLFSIGSTSLLAELVSGPDEGNRLDKLKVFVAAGESVGKELDAVAKRKDKPTIYVFIPSDKFTRPIARFLRGLDEKLKAERPEIDVFAVWLTDEKDKAKEHLPRVQESLKLSRTSWCVFLGEKTGPPEWGINPDADITVIIANGLNVKLSTGYRSINETEIPKVWEKLPPKK